MANNSWSTTFDPLTEDEARVVNVGVRRFNLAHIMERVLALQAQEVAVGVNDTGADDPPASGYPGSLGRLYLHTVMHTFYPTQLNQLLWGKTVKNEGTSLSTGWGIFIAGPGPGVSGDPIYLTDWFDIADDQAPTLAETDIPQGYIVVLGVQVASGNVGAGTAIVNYSPVGIPA